MYSAVLLPHHIPLARHWLCFLYLRTWQWLQTRLPSALQEKKIDVSSCHCRKPWLVVTCGGFSQVIKLPVCRQCLEHWECFQLGQQHSTIDQAENHSLRCGQKRLRKAYFPSVSCRAHKAGEPRRLLPREGVVLLEVWQRDGSNLPIPRDVNNWWNVCNADVDDFTVLSSGPGLALSRSMDLPLSSKD